PDLVHTVEEVRHDDPAVSEARVEAAVGQVADEGEIEAGPQRVSADDELPVGLNGQGEGAGIDAPGTGHGLATIAEARVQLAVREVSGHREPAEAVGDDTARGHHLAVRLEGDGEGLCAVARAGGRRALGGLAWGGRARPRSPEVGDDPATV